MIEEQNNNSVQEQDGNISKPLLCDGFLQENLIIEVRKKDLVALYNFAYELAKKASKKKVNELKEIDLLFNSKGKN